MNYKIQLHSIRLFAFDYDGVFTDGTVLLLPDGTPLRSAYVRDGYAVQWAVKQGLDIAVVTGGREQAVVARMASLGVQQVHLGSENKLAVMERICLEKGITPSQVAYMGDDVPDLPVLEWVGMAACPADAIPEVRSVCDYVSPWPGGKGCVRDVLEQTMRLRGKWAEDGAHHW